MKHLPPRAQQRQYYLATGYSCRGQVQKIHGWKPLHPVQVLGKYTKDEES